MSHEPLNGVLLVNKPAGVTSHDAVMQARRFTHEKRIGHAGTLDPLADGLLVLCLGKATKVVQFLVEGDKTYEAELRLGLLSSTYDAEGAESEDKQRPIPDLDTEALGRVLSRFLGKQKQTVPPHSAVHVGGERLYELTRAGQQIALPEREIEIKSIRLLAYQSPLLSFEVECGKGTYIRSLANDIGKALECGAYLSRLRRTRVSSFSLDQAVQIEDLRDKKLAREKLIPIERALACSTLTVTEYFEPFVQHGRIPSWDDICGVEGVLHRGCTVLLRSERGSALALARAGVEGSFESLSNGMPILEYVRVLV